MKKSLSLLALLVSTSLLADTIAFWQVQKVQSNDVLNVRSLAIHTSSKVTTLPYNTQCVINHGCGKDIDLESMMLMEEDEVKKFLAQAQEGWCYVEYKGKIGWVNQKYIKASSSTCK